MVRLHSDAVALTESQKLVRSSSRDSCSDFDDEYRRQRADGGEYPHEFVDARLQAAKQLTYNAADAAVQTHGGFGIATEYDVERYFPEARLTRLVPITQQLALNYVGENALGLARSY